MKRAPEMRQKATYHPPKLIVYGDLTQLTLASAKGKGMLDGNMAKRT